MGNLMVQKIFFCVALVTLTVSWGEPALAHTGSNAFITINEAPAVEGKRVFATQLQLSISDLHEIFWLDADNNGEVTWAEVKTRQPEIKRFAQEAMILRSNDQVCAGAFSDAMAIAEISGVHYVDLSRQFSCPPGTDPEVSYNGFFNFNTRHRATLTALLIGGTSVSQMFTPERQVLQMTSDGSPLSFKVFSQFMGDGAFHVFTGYDHILFLLLLLLPAVVSRNGKKWVPESSLRRCSVEVLKIVTAFTVAHSLTMGLAVFKILSVSSSIIEPVIAVSIVVAAVNNLWPYMRTSWLIAGVFGLVHGFGFASILQDTGIGGPNAWYLLGSFNLGIEIAQAALVLVAMPVLWHLRRLKFYTSGVMTAGSVGAAVLALIWTFSRIF